MKVLTIKQPYASLIAYGIKKYEFRTWKTKYRGEVLIHAGKSVDKQAMEEFKCYGLDYSLGCAVAKVRITDCIKVDDDFKKILEKEDSLVYNHIINDKNYDVFAFKMEDVKLVEPIYLNGKLGLWNYDGNVNLKK